MNRLVGRRFLHDLSSVHHRDPVGPARNDPEIVSDQQNGHAAAFPKAVEHLQDLRLHRDVERGRRLVGDENLGLAREGDGDHHPLAHPAAELVGVGVESRGGIGDAHLLQQTEGARRAPRLSKP